MLWKLILHFLFTKSFFCRLSSGVQDEPAPPCAVPVLWHVTFAVLVILSHRPILILGVLLRVELDLVLCHLSLSDTGHVSLPTTTSGIF